ncbi:thialysine N-epsilon-acetyltransferase-like isoform X1 [Sceloporus undulatus]|uniref:thialysine N-epsilon-acetyltransferase-like isoform X1 n=1 Tax=Sceloporus undulatus TaxID=8520 RepID=UPI001C4B8903|nr:thialysine N-epsilon-acetyltransferase-like isoform X1 [Sceloporus undulatus]
MNYIIRPWAIKDLKEVMRLIRESAAFHKALDQVKTTPETFRDDGFGKEATFGCLVAEVPPEEKTKEGHSIIGYQFHYVSYCTWDGPVLFGEDLYVMPDFRGKGIGTNLMKKVSQIALEKGCSQFRFISDKWNQPAMNFYTKLGAVNVTDLNHWIVCHIDQPDIKKLAEQVREERSG